MAQFASLIELNVSGVHYTASLKTLTSQPNSLLAKWFTPGSEESADLLKDSKVRHECPCCNCNRESSRLFFLAFSSSFLRPRHPHVSEPSERMFVTQSLLTECLVSECLVSECLPWPPNVWPLIDP